MKGLYLKNLIISFCEISLFLIPFLVFYVLLKYVLLVSISISVIIYVLTKADLRTEDDIRKMYYKNELDKLRNKFKNIKVIISKNKE